MSGLSKAKMVQSSSGGSGWLERCALSMVPCLEPFQGDPSRSERGKRGLKGLINMGNTCYMSCILQVLAHNPATQAYFLHGGHDSQGCDATMQLWVNSPAPFATKICLACELTRLFATLFEHRGKSHQESYSFNPLAPHGMLYATWKTSDRMASYVQQDAHEFLMVLLDGLTHNIRGRLPASVGFVHEVFRGSLRSDVVSTCRAQFSRILTLSKHLLSRFVGVVVQKARVESPFLT